MKQGNIAMKITKLLLITPLICLLPSCVSLGNTEAPAAFLVLTPTNSISANQESVGNANNAIIVNIPDTPRKLDTNRIPVQVSDSSIAYVQGAFWSDKPARLMQQLIAETIIATTGQLVLDEAQSGGKAKQRISGTLSEFGVVESGSYAIVRFDAIKINGENIIEKRRFEAKRDIFEITASDSGAALNKAANDVAEQIAIWSK